MDCTCQLSMCAYISSRIYYTLACCSTYCRHWMNSGVLKSQRKSQCEAVKLFKQKGAYDLVVLYAACLDLNIIKQLTTPQTQR